jgi:hypothetical protein
LNTTLRIPFTQILAEDHHIDNEQKAVDFINQSGLILNTKAYLMHMTSNDEEQDCSGVKGSNSMFEFRFAHHSPPFISNEHTEQQRHKENYGCAKNLVYVSTAWWKITMNAKQEAG